MATGKPSSQLSKASFWVQLVAGGAPAPCSLSLERNFREKLPLVLPLSPSVFLNYMSVHVMSLLGTIT